CRQTLPAVTLTSPLCPPIQRTSRCTGSTARACACPISVTGRSLNRRAPNRGAIARRMRPPSRAARARPGDLTRGRPSPWAEGQPDLQFLHEFEEIEQGITKLGAAQD